MNPLADWLDQGYAWEHQLPDAIVDPAIGLRDAGYSREALTAKRDELRAVEQRCVVSKTQRVFLDRVLGMME